MSRVAGKQEWGREISRVARKQAGTSRVARKQAGSKGYNQGGWGTGRGQGNNECSWETGRGRETSREARN